jgi:hypothetical protein
MTYATNLENRTAVIIGSRSGTPHRDRSYMERPGYAGLASSDSRECFTSHYREALQLRFSHYNVSATIEI